MRLSVLFLGLIGASLSGCETSDPCVLRQAACLDVSLIGEKTDSLGAPIAYRDVAVRVCSGPKNASLDCAEGQTAAGCTEQWAQSDALTLTAVASYSANVQGLVSFQLPASFNDLADDPPNAVDNLDPTARVARLKTLRDQDPRAVRIFVTQNQGSAAQVVWDSRCAENLFSQDQWSKLKYYRVGKNDYVPVFASMKRAKTSAP